MEDKLERSNRRSRIDHKLKDKTISVTDLNYVGLPLALALSEHLGVVGFGMDVGVRSPIKAMNQYAPPTHALMMIDDDRRR